MTDPQKLPPIPWNELPLWQKIVTVLITVGVIVGAVYLLTRPYR